MRKNGNAVALGKRGGRAAWKHVSTEERSRIMKERAAKRDKKK